MSAALDIRGFKRICTSCGTRFYDLSKRPIVCPSCKTEFTGEMKLKARRGRAGLPAAEKAAEARSGKIGVAAEAEDDEILTDDIEIVSLEDAEEKDDDADDDESDAGVPVDLDEEDLEDLDDLEDEAEEDLEDLDEDLGSLTKDDE